MITDSFDNKSRPFLTSKTFYGQEERNDLVCLVTFKQKVLEYAIEKYNGKLYKQYKTTNGYQEIYILNVEDKQYLMYMTPIGATVASTIMDEVCSVCGTHQFIYFGSCGVLDERKCRHKVIVPTSSYRDEGISYHYYPASDYIEVRNGEKLFSILEKLGVPCVKGPIWTTDAIYMETMDKIKKRKEEGALAVEMEVSGVEAVARYLNISNYHFLFGADSLDGTEWDRSDLGGDPELKLQIESFEIALRVASELKKAQ